MASDDAIVVYRLVAAERGFLERKLDLSLDVALVPPSHSEDAEEIAQNAVERDVADVDGPAGKGAASPEGRTWLLRPVAKAIVHRPSTVVREDLIREVDFFEAFVRVRIVRMAIGMVLGGELLERALYLLGCGVALDSEDLVVVPLRHSSRRLTSIPHIVDPFAPPASRALALLNKLVAPLSLRLGVTLGSCACCMTACKAASFDPPDAATSPQARAEPAPLASMPLVANAAGSIGPDTGRSPEPLLSDRAVEPDALGEGVHEPGSKDAHETGGYSLQAVVRSGEGPGPPKAPEVNLGAIDSARRKTEARMTIEFGTSRARFIFGGGFVVPPATELRARVDRYGHFLLWPGEATYRIAEAGAVRALLGERRLDVAPQSPADVRSSPETGRRLNMRTRRVEIATRAAKAAFELASLRDAGEGGTLVCRLLLELMSASPASPACASDEVPLHAELRWATSGLLTFDVTSIARRTEFQAGSLGAPPSSLTFVTSPPPFSPAELLVSRAELAAFRTGPVDVPLPEARDAQPAPPETGLLLVNASDELRVVWLDGVEIAWIAPGARLALPMLLRGRYALQWRTFLGDSRDPADAVVVPGVSELETGR